MRVNWNKLTSGYRVRILVGCLGCLKYLERAPWFTSMSRRRPIKTYQKASFQLGTDGLLAGDYLDKRNEDIRIRGLQQARVRKKRGMRVRKKARLGAKHV